MTCSSHKLCLAERQHTRRVNCHLSQSCLTLAKLRMAITNKEITRDFSSPHREYKDKEYLTLPFPVYIISSTWTLRCSLVCAKAYISTEHHPATITLDRGSQR